MAYYEKNFQTDFNKWSKYLFRKTGAFELKISDGASIPFSDVVEHQVNALLAAKNDCVIHKMPDTGYQNPFDSFQLCGVPAYIVIMFRAQERNQKEFVMIDIEAWEAEKLIATRKSLTEARAKELGLVYRLS